MNETDIEKTSPVKKPSAFFQKNREWVNILLFFLTIFSAFVVGISWSASYKFAEAIGRDPNFMPPAGLFKDPEILSLSLVYAAVLILILLGHELGHYLMCRRYRISATLPFFIPAPTLTGTMGAFIKIKSPITRKRQLFDIGVSGPLAGFLISLPALYVGLSLSKIVPALPQEGTLYFGEPLLLKIIGSMFFKDIGPDFAVIPHPVAFAGWVGVFVTALNLFPLGQLDGGHISYAVFGSKSKVLSRAVLGVFVIMGVFFWAGWLIFALLTLALGLKHPQVWDEGESLGTKRKIIGFLILVIFILSFIPDPVQGYNLFDLIGQYRH